MSTGISPRCTPSIMTKGHASAKHASTTSNKVVRKIHDKVLGPSDPSSHHTHPHPSSTGET